MKKTLLFLTLLISCFVNAQIYKPVTWKTSVEKKSDKEYILITEATIEKGWHLYSQTVPQKGPIPTSFTYITNKGFLKKGNTLEEEGHVVDDPVFGMQIKFFENKTVFKQHIRLKEKESFIVNAVVEFMVCDDTRCLPPSEVDLIFNISQ